jgi:hypothetical protein
VIYNLGVVLVLGDAGIRSRTVGVVLWPAVILHTAMTVWCIVSLVNWKPEGRESGVTELRFTNRS